MKYNKIIFENILESALRFTNEILQFENIKLDINFNIQDSEVFNAKTSLIEDDYYSITMNSEIFRKISDVLDVLLYEENHGFYKMISFDVEYQHEKAISYYFILMQVMVKLIFYHEIGHVVNGHLRYKLSRECQSQQCTMFMNSENNNLDCLESQVLEMDADAFSATMLVRQITYPENLKQFPDIIKGKGHGFFLLIISANLLFAIQGLMYKTHTRDLEKLSYLPLKTRQDYYLRCATVAYNYYNEKIEYDIITLRETYSVISNLIEQLNIELWGHNCIDYKYESLDDKCLEHCDYLERFWTDVMRPKLLQYSHTANLAL